MSERHLSLVEPSDEQTVPNHTNGYLTRRGRHDSGVKKLPAPDWQVFDPEAVYVEPPVSRGQHEGELRQPGWTEVEGAITYDPAPLPQGRHEHGQPTPSARQRLGQLLMNLLEAKPVRTWR